MAKEGQGASWASPLNGDPRFAAMALLNAGDPKGALNAFATLTEVDSEAGDVPHQADALSGEAMALERLKRWGMAENLRRFTSNHPVFDPTWCSRGIVYLAREG
jgi:hypothetical protein